MHGGACMPGAGKAVDMLGDAERVCLELMRVRGVEARLNMYSLRFSVPHKLQAAKQVGQWLVQTYLACVENAV